MFRIEAGEVFKCRWQTDRRHLA